MRPIGNRIIIEPRKVGETSPGGIVTPEAYRQRDVSWDGIVKHGTSKLPEVREGNRVLVNRYNMVVIEREGMELWVAKPEDILAILEEN